MRSIRRGVVGVAVLLVALSGCGSESRTVCKPGEYFCDGSQIRQCSADGSTSTLRTECSTEVVCNKCGECETGDPICIRANPVCAATLSGILAGDWEKKQCATGCGGDNECATRTTASGGSTAFSHSNSAPGYNEQHLFVSIADLSKVASGQAVALHGTEVQAAAASVFVYTTGGTYSNKTSWAATHTPPSNGNLRLTYTSTNPGDTWMLEITGELSKDETIWEAFSYTASGVFLPATP